MWPRLAQVLLNEPWAEMNVQLNERTFPDTLEAVDLTGLDYKDVACAPFKRLAVHCP